MKRIFPGVTAPQVMGGFPTIAALPLSEIFRPEKAQESPSQPSDQAVKPRQRRMIGGDLAIEDHTDDMPVGIEHRAASHARIAASGEVAVVG